MKPKSSQDYENHVMARRQLLQSLGMLAGATVVGGAVAHGQQPAPKEPAPPRLGAGPRMKWLKDTYPRSGAFKAVGIGHISYSTPDQRKARDWYIDVFSMQAVFDQGTSTAVRFGIPWNHIYITQNQDKKSRGNISHMAYNIEDFRLEAVEAELTARGLYHSYDGPFMIHTDDPEKFRLQPSAMTAVFPGGANSDIVDALGEEDGLKKALRDAPRPNYRTFVASAMNHISHNCVDYGKVRDYYMDVWSMKKVSDDGKVAVVEFGGTFGDPPQQIWLRGGNKPGAAQYIDHIGYSIENFDSAKVGAELKKRGLNPRQAGPNAWAIDDVAGYPIQICAERGVTPADAYKVYGG